MVKRNKLCALCVYTADEIKFLVWFVCKRLNTTCEKLYYLNPELRSEVCGKGEGSYSADRCNSSLANKFSTNHSFTSVSFRNRALYAVICQTSVVPQSFSLITYHTEVRLR